MHKEDAWWDDMLQLLGTNRAHGMTIDTNNPLIVVDRNNNQLKHEDDVGKEDMDDNMGLRQRSIATKAQWMGRLA